jgi:hypothetical protein
VNKAKRLEAAVALCQAGGLPCNDLEADLAALSRAVVERGGPGAVAPKNWQADPTLSDDPEPPAYDQDPAGWIAWCERELDRLTGQGQQRQAGAAGDREQPSGEIIGGADAGSAPPGAAAWRKAEEARVRAAAPAPRMTPSGWPLPPVDPGTRDQGDAEQSPNRGKRLQPREPGSYGY